MDCYGNGPVLIGSDIYNQVVKPARYTGQEYNSVNKDFEKAAVRIVLAMPDIYEVGLSNLGLKILYEILNNRADTLAERVYAPWTDMEEKMRENNLPLYTLESRRPVQSFDLVGFSLQYELSYTNVLNMLDLSGIPLLAKDRTDGVPLVACGGPCAFNAEPMADFIDFFILGEGEEVIGEVAETIAFWKKGGKEGGRQGILKSLATIEGVYVPSFYEVIYGESGQVAGTFPLAAEAKPVIKKRVVQDLDRAFFLSKQIVPYIEIVHDRIMLELFRGCTRGCRFCQAGVIYRPVREKRVETLLRQAQELVNNTGYNEISLGSLSSADYSSLKDLIDRFMEVFKDKRVSISLPSLRIDSFSIELAKEVGQVRKSGLTFAPEAGTQRLRDVINKGVTEENLKEAAAAAFRSGWSSLKLYFMIGLPTETEEDVAAIARLTRETLDIYKEVHGRRGAKITVSVSSFVPKPHTPFQRVAQNTPEELEGKQRLLRSLITDRNINLNWHDVKTSAVEGALARGDRRLGKVILCAWRNGAKFDGWSEHFKYDVWLKAFEEADLDPGFYANRERPKGEKMPWDHLSSLVDREFLEGEYQNALAAKLTLDCRRGNCGNCGVCLGESSLKNICAAKEEKGENNGQT